MSLCRSCQRFSIHSFSADPDNIRSYQLAVVENGSREGCDFCDLLRTTLKNDIAWLPYPSSFCWVQLILRNDAGLVGEPSLGLQYNKLNIKIANRPFLRPQLRSLDDEVGSHELRVVADEGQ